MSFSGIKTAFLHLVRHREQEEQGSTQRDLDHLCAVLERCIIDLLLDKLRQAALQVGVQHVALSGGVSANSSLRTRTVALAEREGWTAHLLPPVYCTDNAAMIAMAGHYSLLAGRHAPLDVVPIARSTTGRADH